MNCLVTAGPTYEPLDEVRRLTNFSTGRLGSLLATHLAERGHNVTLLIGHYATWRGECLAQQVQMFSTTEDLREQLRARQDLEIHAIYHAAAVSDFGFGAVYQRLADGSLSPVDAKKIPTRGGAVLAELTPTAKILPELRGWFPRTRIAGWKYEVDGDRATAIGKGARQLEECRTDACVINGPAYGQGFGLLRPTGSTSHSASLEELFTALEDI